MKKALDIVFNSVQVLNDIQLGDFSVNHLCSDSRQAKKDSIFFALRGTRTDGHQYLMQVVEQGCSLLVVEEINPSIQATQIQVSDSHLALAICAENFYGNPSKSLQLIGVTGTNGKTTTTTLLQDVFMQLGHSCGLLSTVVNKINSKEIPSTHTTPDPISLSFLLAQMVEEGCTHVFMEVSSHAIHQKRIAGLTFSIGVFTNITHDHLDYHSTFAEYRDVKKLFFDHLPKTAHALVNIDDKNGLVMVQNTKAKIHTYALKSPAEFKTKVLENLLSGLVLQMNGTEIWTQLIGNFNAYNLTAVFGVSQILDEEPMEVLRIISQLKSVDGRFQQFKTESGVTCIVDYAHTPDALENVLSTIKSFHDVKEIVTVIGCGGDRDKTKRPEMAQIAAKFSNQTILTSDNPRTENPSVILEEMEAGLSAEQATKTLTIEDRKSAIKTAIKLSKAGTALLIAGKGHEKYQEINGVKHPFDDYALAYELFKQIKN
ncbi:MAG: UDP-N-acetylmuramoyl-L-alanyl-D-glutamate--2,6-diaminopimelate ligase [Bacteroidetes bacterium]|nr:UDP-N-acetylmuramoyl-L-alanyl-D-glutamate--2,6-diaminopimelate ligase [Bacteroidota bacterium]